MTKHGYFLPAFFFSLATSLHFIGKGNKLDLWRRDLPHITQRPPARSLSSQETVVLTAKFPNSLQKVKGIILPK